MLSACWQVVHVQLPQLPPRSACHVVVVAPADIAQLAASPASAGKLTFPTSIDPWHLLRVRSLRPILLALLLVHFSCSMLHAAAAHTSRSSSPLPATPPLPPHVASAACSPLHRPPQLASQYSHSLLSPTDHGRGSRHGVRHASRSWTSRRGGGRGRGETTDDEDSRGRIAAVAPDRSHVAVPTYAVRERRL